MLCLLHDKLTPGDRMFRMGLFGYDIDTAAVESASGVKKLLLVNKCNRDIILQLPPGVRSRQHHHC